MVATWQMPPATLGTVWTPPRAGVEPEAPLEPGLERRRADLFVERERPARRDDHAVQSLGGQGDVLRLLGHGPDE